MEADRKSHEVNSLSLETKIAEFVDSVDLDEVAHCFPSQCDIVWSYLFLKFSDENFLVCFFGVKKLTKILPSLP